MRELIGPFWVVNHESQAHWGYIDLNEDRFTFYMWNTTRWTTRHLEVDEIWHSYFPHDSAFVAWANTNMGLIKAPLMQSPLDENGLSRRFLTKVLHPVFLEDEVRWVPVHMKKASDFGFTTDAFPLTMSEELQPILTEAPSVSVDVNSHKKRKTQLFQPQPLLPTVIEAQQAIEHSRLSLAQQSFIAQCIEINGHWPIDSAMTRSEKIQRCLGLINGGLNDVELYPIKNYRDLKFLARLMTGSFYPQQESEAGAYTTVGDVWFYINLLLGTAAQQLGHKGRISYPAPPKGSGCRAPELLSRMKVSVLPSSGLTVHQGIAYQWIVDAVAESLGMEVEDEEENEEEVRNLLTISQCNTKELTRVTDIIQCLLRKQASQIDLSTRVFNASKGLFSGQGMDDNAVLEFIDSLALNILQSIVIERLNRDVQACCVVPLNLQAIDHLAETIRDVNEITPVFDAFILLPMRFRGLLIDKLGVDVRCIFKLDSQAVLMSVLQSTPNEQHPFLIRVFAKDIYALNETEPLNMQIIQSLVNEAAYKLLSDTVRNSWCKSSEALLKIKAPPISATSMSAESNAIPTTSAILSTFV